MSTTAIRTCELALETGVAGFANISTTTGAPTTAGLTYVGLECERASLTTFGEPVLQDRLDARAGPHWFAPEYDTAVVSGARATRLQGTVELTMVLRTLGDASAVLPGSGDFDTYTGPTGIPWVNILNSMWAADTINGTGNLKDAVLGPAVSANEWIAGAPLQYAPGQLVSLPIDDRIEWTSVTDVAAGNVIASPAMSRSLALGDIVNMGRTFYPPNDLTTAVGPSFALRLNGAGWEWLAFGCRAEVMKIARRGRMMTVSFTIRCAHIEPGTGSNEADFRAALGSVAHQTDSYTVISALTAPVDGNAAPVQLPRSTVPVDEFEFTATQPLVARGTTENLVGVAEWEVGNDPTYEMSMTASVPSSALDFDLVDMNKRSILVGFGPHGIGEGACIYMPAAVMTSSPQTRDLGNGIVRQKLTFRNGRWYGDGTGFAPAHSSVRIGLSR